MNKIYTLTSLLVCSLALGGCDTFRNTFGLDHSSPNEWNTTEPSPGLILPPDFNSRPKLPPPTPGAPNPHAIPETVKAQKTVLGEAHSPDTSPSTAKGEQDIVEKASENQPITPNIRKIVDEEAQEESTVSGKVISKIRSWKKEAAKNLNLSKPKVKNTDGHDHHPQDEDMNNGQDGDINDE
jgi:hypothetical protein